MTRLWRALRDWRRGYTDDEARWVYALSKAFGEYFYGPSCGAGVAGEVPASDAPTNDSRVPPPTP